MKKTFSKVLAGVTASAIALSLVAGAGAFKTASASEGTEVSLVPWTIYEGAEVGRSNDPDGWPTRTYNTVSTTAGESKDSVFWNTGLPHQQYVDSPEVIWQTTQVANGFTADIAGTGWDGDEWVGSVANKDNPYLLRAYMTGIQAQEGHMYTVSFKAAWVNNEKAPEKNIQIGVANAYGEDVFKDVENPVTKIKVASGSSTTYSQDFTLWAGDTLDITLSYGAFIASYNKGLTTENVAAKGVLTISDFKLIDKGQNPEYVPKPTIWTDPEETTAPKEQTTAKPQPKPSVDPAKKKVFAQVTGVKAKNNKKGKLTVTWKKIANAKQYQIKVGKRTYTSKAGAKKYVVKKGLKKGKTVKVQVRALAANGYKAGKFSKVVKVKIKK